MIYSIKNKRFLILVSIILTFVLLALFFIGFVLSGQKSIDGYLDRYQPCFKGNPVCRGVIRDRNGKVLAANDTVMSLYINPQEIKNKQKISSDLSRILNLDEKMLAEKLASDKKFVWIKRRLTEEEYQEVSSLSFQGIGFIQECQRSYPNGKIASQLLGFVGVDYQGLEGVEHAYEKELASEPPCPQMHIEVNEKPSLKDKFRCLKTAPGKDLDLTIDLEIQKIAENALDEAMEKYHPEKAIALVMNPKTGEILANAIRPNYDPINPNSTNISYTKNRVVTDIFEPGGTFEPILLSAALESGISEKKIFNCENGEWRFGEFTIHDTKPFSELTVADIFKNGSNIGASKLALKIGLEKYHDYIRKFGFGEKTGIQLSGEVDGIIRNPEKEPIGDFITQAFGQGIAVTPLQLLSAFNAVVNGGNLIRPFMVQNIFKPNDDENMQRNEPRIVKRVISEESSKKARKVLAGMELDLPASKNIKVAGKAGIAQKVDPITGKYHHTSVVASFIGCVNDNDPTLSILVILNEPQGEGRYHGSVAAAAFIRIAENSLKYLDRSIRER